MNRNTRNRKKTNLTHIVLQDLVILAKGTASSANLESLPCNCIRRQKIDVIKRERQKRKEDEDPKNTLFEIRSMT